MSGLKLRRNSVDVKQYSIKLQQQNLDDIKSLKLSTTIASGTANNQGQSTNDISTLAMSVGNDEQLSHEVRAKLLASKLTARKLKNLSTSISGESKDKDRKLSVTFNPVIEKDLHKQITDDTIIKYEYKNNDMELLLQEKLHWLTRQHEDNAKIAALLDDVQRTKRRVAGRLSELTHERNKLRAFLASDGQVHSIDALERFLIEESLICPSRRSQCIPNEHHGEAEQLLQQLLGLTAQLRCNQSEVNEHFKELLQKTIDSYASIATTTSGGSSQSNTDFHSLTSSFDQSLNSLHAIVDGDPRNIAAATRLAASFAETFIDAAGEQAEASLLGGSMRSDRYIAKVVEELREENRLLRLRLAEEERKSSQLQAKVAAYQVPPTPSVKSPQPPSRSRFDTNPLTPKPISSSSSSSSSADRASIDESKASMGPSNNIYINDDGDADMRAVVDMVQDIHLPSVVDKFLLDQITILAKATIRSHPVGAVLDDTCINLLSELIMRDATTTARLAFVSSLQHRIGLMEVFGHTSTVFDVFEGIHEEDVGAIDWCSDAVELVTKSSVVNKEVMALTTFYCTYLYSSRSADSASTAFDDDDDGGGDDGNGSSVNRIDGTVYDPSNTAVDDDHDGGDVIKATSDAVKSGSSGIGADTNASITNDYIDVQESFNLSQDTSNTIITNNNSNANRIYVPPPSQNLNAATTLSPVKRYMMPKQTSSKR